jgi:archaemetzincin
MTSKKKIIAVQPLGSVSEAALKVVAASLQEVYQIQTEVFPNQSVPDEAYNPHRGQHNCYPILKFLRRLMPEHAIKTMGVTDVDLFIPILTYVFGEAELGGEATVISTWRLTRGAGEDPVLEEKVLDRAAKIAVHELAHTFRLQHCREDGCIMGSFPALGSIDERPIEFCRYCEMFLRDEYQRLGLVPFSCL